MRGVTGCLGPRALLARCAGLSSSVLYERLRELETSGLLRRHPNGSYALTELGSELGDAIAPLDRWATRWATTTGG